MSRSDENLKARVEDNVKKRYETGGETQQEGRPSPIDPSWRDNVATEVPAREILMNWIEDAERELIGQLTSLHRVRDRVRYADEYTCQIVRDLIRSDIRRNF